MFLEDKMSEFWEINLLQTHSQEQHNLHKFQYTEIKYIVVTFFPIVKEMLYLQ